MNGKGGNIWLSRSKERISFLVQHFELLHPTKSYNKAKLRNGDKQVQRLPLPDETVKTFVACLAGEYTS